MIRKTRAAKEIYKHLLKYDYIVNNYSLTLYDNSLYIYILSTLPVWYDGKTFILHPKKGNDNV